MKKIITTILVTLVLIFTLSTDINASASVFDVVVNGNNTKVYNVGLQMDGKNVNSDFAPYIYNDRTFVPVRVVAEHFDSQVDWFQSSKSVTIAKGNDLIVISVGKTEAIKNGEPIILNKDSTPMLVAYPNGEYKTMVPLRVISELLGYDVQWNQSSRSVSINGGKPEVKPEPSTTNVAPATPARTGVEITSIEKVNGSTKNEQVKLKANGEIKYTSKFDVENNSLYIEISNAYFNISGKSEGILEPKGNLVQYLEYKSNGNNTAKIRIQLNRNVNPNIKSSNGGKELNVSFTNIVTAIRPIIYEGESAILVEGVKTSEHNIIKLNNPFRYVIDIKDATFLSDKKFEKYDIPMRFVQEVRASQFVPDGNYSANDNIVRVVLDSLGESDGGQVKIAMLGDDMVIIPRSSTATNITKPDSTDKGDLPSNPITTDGVDNGKIFDDIETEEIIERKPRKTPHSKKEVVIVVDAGHGGKDPGATSNGYNEKDINIDVAKRVQSQLENEGYTVVMTRNSDTAVNIMNRPKIANESDAHVFLSIHANSSLNTESEGIESLYAPRDLTSVKYDAQYPLVKAVHTELIKATGMFDRGIKQRPDLIVLKHTEMSAALVELGFMSNEKDLELLQTDSYKQSCANGIVEGIKKYVFDTYGY